MDAKAITAVCKQVYQQFPEVSGCQPKVREQAEDTFLLLFEAKVKTSDGRSLPRTVRAVANGQGKIKKLTTSR